MRLPTPWILDHAVSFHTDEYAYASFRNTRLPTCRIEFHEQFAARPWRPIERLEELRDRHEIDELCDLQVDGDGMWATQSFVADGFAVTQTLLIFTSGDDRIEIVAHLAAGDAEFDAVSDVFADAVEQLNVV